MNEAALNPGHSVADSILRGRAERKSQLLRVSQLSVKRQPIVTGRDRSTERAAVRRRLLISFNLMDDQIVALAVQAIELLQTQSEVQIEPCRFYYLVE
jgi:hypothetical protein